jgi:lysophospholipase L1-like esterase
MGKVFLLLALFCGSITLTGQQIKIGAEVTMLALGDSYTIGQSVDTVERWPHQFVDQLRSIGVTADDPDYIATTGWSTRRLIQGLNSMLDENRTYNLVSILIGVNNQYQGIDISSYEPDLRRIFDHALEIVGQDTSRVFVLSIPDYAFTPFGGGDASISREIDDYNRIKKRVAAEYHFAFIDITPISRTGLSNPSLVAADGLHPSGKQYGEWVKEIFPRLNFSQALTGTGRPGDTGHQLKVYPNPAGSKLFIESSLEIDRIRIYNSMGGLVDDKTLNSMPAELDLSHLGPGTYVLYATPKGADEPVLLKTIIIQPVSFRG